METLKWVFYFIAMLVAMTIAVFVGTSSAFWYAGGHDSRCEKAMGNECKCYERALAR